MKLIKETENKEELKVTDATKISEYAGGALVELPPFAEGQEFVAKVRRPSLMEMVANGTFSNPLMQTVNVLFNETEGESRDYYKDPENMKNMYNVLHSIAGQMLVEPTLEELERSGLSLTDEQLMFLYMYQQRGVNTLNSFRLFKKN